MRTWRTTTGPKKPSSASNQGRAAPSRTLGGTDTQAAEALKLIAGIESALVGRLLMLDARAMEWTEMRVDRDVDCTICRVRRSVPPGGTT